MKITSTIEATKLRQIGAGQGMNSEVFLCHDPQLDGEIVIKEVPVSHFSMPDEFFSEAQRLYANKHPRVVPLHYACRDADKIRIAMPFFANGSLQDKINQGPLSIRQVIWWAQQFLSGLHYIHSNGFIHFDIKPSNILIHDDASVMISDFGQARPTNHLGVGEIPPMYPGHLTPEFFQFSMATKQSDIYQVGLTLYRMCNGDDLFKSQMPATGQELRDQILNGTFPNRNKFLPHVPNRLRRVIRKALKVNPAERQQTAMELMNELGQVNSLLDWEYSKHGENCYWQRKGENHEYHIQMIKNASNQWFIEGFTIRLDNKQKRAKTDWCAGPFNTFLQAERVVSQMFRQME